MASVELKNVTKVYDKNVTAVKNANLSIHDTEFLVLVGPSGCGKSTLLRMIAGLEDITDGTIEISDKLVNDVPPKDRNIAMVFQNYALYPHMTVRENMAFGLKLRKFPKKEINERVQTAAEILNIKDLLDRKPKALSGGQRQRVAVGRAIVRQPDVFLFDEPLSNLDAKLRVQMRIEITKLHQKLSATMIYVTHDQVEAMTMGDRIVVMNDGVIQQVDTPLNLYNNPQNIFVAGFIGSPAMNFCEGEIIEDKILQFKTESFAIPIKTALRQQLGNFKNTKIIMGARPEHFYVAIEPVENKTSIQAKVEVLEPMGNEIIAYFNSGTFNFTVRCPADINLDINNTVYLIPDMDHVHFFEKDSGKVLD